MTVMCQENEEEDLPALDIKQMQQFSDTGNIQKIQSKNEEKNNCMDTSTNKLGKFPSRVPGHC